MAHVVAFYGKVRIPTVGHAKVASVLSSMSVTRKADAVVGISNAPSPLTEATRDEILSNVFSRARIIKGTPETQNLISFLSSLSESYDSIDLVCGSDRYKEYVDVMNRCNNSLFTFDSWNVIQAGSTRGNARALNEMSGHNIVKNASASAVQTLAESKDYHTFKKFMPRALSERLLKRAFREISNSRIDENIKHAELLPMVNAFVDFAGKELDIKKIPRVYLKKGNRKSTSFGGYYPHSGEIHISTKNRHPMDVFRTLAHELVHHKQNEEGRITNPAEEGGDGSDIENEANSVAGVLMRKYGRNNPRHFGLKSITEARKKKDNDDPNNREEGTDSLVTIYSKGTPGQGKKKKGDRNYEGEGLDTGPLNVGIGPTFGGNERPYGGYTFSEGVERWMNSPNTISKYEKEYGPDYISELYEHALLMDSRLSRISESIDKGLLDMGTIAKQGSDDPGFEYDDEPVRVLPKLNKKDPDKYKE